jgi:hypothetical protein
VVMEERTRAEREQACLDVVTRAIAGNIHPHNHDRSRMEDLVILLQAFAAEVRRSAIEP